MRALSLGAGPAGTDQVLKWGLAFAAYGLLFWEPLAGTVRLWLTEPDAGHGLLLAPVAAFLAVKQGRSPGARGQLALATTMLVFAVALRYLGALAAELFTMRVAAVLALFGLAVAAWGVRQLMHWWLPVTLVLLSLPLPEVLNGTLARPLQFQASEMGASLLTWRHVPVQLSGNVIHLPGQTLFVTEACSGLRSLSALLSLGVLIGGVWLQTWWGRVALIAAALPIAMVLNSVRIFLTGFAVFFISEEMGRGLMHYTEGWVMFLAAFAVLGFVAWVVTAGERWHARRREAAA